MIQEKINCKSFIIAGTMKSATTSVFTYLSAHPQICGSSVKETLFFGNNYTGGSNDNLVDYMKYFGHISLNEKYIMEASPGYIHGGLVVAKRIKKMLPDAKLLFILRNPIDRLYSYYNFVTNHTLDKDYDRNIDFDEYVENCIQYSNGKKEINNSNNNSRHYKVLEFGRYEKYLKDYYQIFPSDQIRVLFYEHLKDDIKVCMSQLCDFLEIDGDFFNDYTFKTVNTTFSSRVKFLQVIALAVNKRLEKCFRQRPKLKGRIVSIYKSINKKTETFLPMSNSTRLRLEEYYSQSNRELADMLPGYEVASWVK